ncbi:MAG: gamma carbonic anhydrase family protein [Thermoplasmata archaeon]
MAVKIPSSCFIADDAVIIGDVGLGEGCSVWFKAVIRGDKNTIKIGEGTNIQDCVVVHVDNENPASIGRNVSVGHGAVVHGCTIGDDVIIGMNAAVLSGAKVGKGCIIGANALVTSSMDIPDHSLAVGIPAKVIKTDESLMDSIRSNAERYHEMRDAYKEKKFVPHPH